MRNFLLTGFIFVLFLGIPLAAVIWFLRCLGQYRSAVPFTEEKQRRKFPMILSGIIAGILVAIVLICLIVYAVAIM